MAASRSKAAGAVFQNIFRLSHNTKRVYSCDQSLSLKNIVTNYRDIELRPYCVECTKRFGQSFTNAQVHPFPYCVDENRNVVDPFVIDFEQSKKLRSFYLDFKPLFGDGIEKVESVISQDDALPSEKENESKCLHKAVHTLEKFLHNIEFHQRCLSDMVENTEADYTELETTILLANHLFSPLVTCDPKDIHCIITDDSESKISMCPCAERCDTEILYGDSSFGSAYLWFGSADIMLYPTGGGLLNIAVKNWGKEDIESLEEEEEETAYLENPLRTHNSVQQVVSQAITFSLYQRKYQLQMNTNPVTTLIPTIITSKHHFDVYLYDTQNDILLRNLGGPIPIFEKHLDSDKDFNSKFNLSSIIQLWMLINHLLLQPKFTANQLNVLKNTCGVKKQIQALNLMNKIEDSLMTGSEFSPPRMQDARAFDKINC